jgi:hypothetical protein
MEMTEPTTILRQTRNRYCKRALAAAVVVGVLTLLAGQKAMGKGLVLGTLFSIANFSIMAYLLPANFSNSRMKTFFTAFLSIGGRYALMAVPLILALTLERFSWPATVVGLFMVQLVILAEHGLKLLKTRKLDAV